MKLMQSAMLGTIYIQQRKSWRNAAVGVTRGIFPQARLSNLISERWGLYHTAAIPAPNAFLTLAKARLSPIATTFQMKSE